MRLSLQRPNSRVALVTLHHGAASGAIRAAYLALAIRRQHLWSMPLAHDRLTRTLTKARARRLRGRVRALVDAAGSDLVDLEDAEFARLCKDLVTLAARRAKKMADEYGGLRGAERKARIRELLLHEVRSLALRSVKKGNSAWWWGGRFRKKEAWKHVADHLTDELRKLFKRRKVSWRTLRYYTAAEVKDWYIDQVREQVVGDTAAAHGLLRHIKP